MIPNVGPGELIMVLVIALLVLGPKKLPEAGKSLGRGLREFKDSLAGDSKPDDETPAQAYDAADRTLPRV